MILNEAEPKLPAQLDHYPNSTKLCSPHTIYSVHLACGTHLILINWQEYYANAKASSALLRKLGISICQQMLALHKGRFRSQSPNPHSTDSKWFHGYPKCFFRVGFYHPHNKKHLRDLPSSPAILSHRKIITYFAGIEVSITDGTSIIS